MYPDNIEKIFKDGQAVKLDEKKKDLMRQELLSFVKKHPVQALPIGGFSFLPTWFLASKKLSVVLAGLLVFIVLGSTAVVSAAGSLPGDFLYPIKLGFNEKIQEAMAFSDQAKLDVSVQLANTRLEEAEKLSVQGRMNAQAEATISNNFKIHANDALHYINKLQAKTEDKKTVGASINVEESLKAHTIIIDRLQKDELNNARAEDKIKDVEEKSDIKIDVSVPQVLPINTVIP